MLIANFLNNDFHKKTNDIHWNYIKNTTVYQSFIQIQCLVDFRKDPNLLLFILIKRFMFPTKLTRLLCLQPIMLFWWCF